MCCSDGAYMSPLSGRKVVEGQIPGEGCISLSKGTRFGQSRLSRPDHQGVSDENLCCC